jgi:hypothetical protein
MAKGLAQEKIATQRKGETNAFSISTMLAYDYDADAMNMGPLFSFLKSTRTYLSLWVITVIRHDYLDKRLDELET